MCYPENDFDHFEILGRARVVEYLTNGRFRGAQREAARTWLDYTPATPVMPSQTPALPTKYPALFSGASAGWTSVIVAIWAALKVN